MRNDEFADFYHREQFALVRFAATIVGPDRADDVVANAMVSVMNRFRDNAEGSRASTSPDTMRPYVYKAVANAGAKEWRTLGRRQRRESLAARLHPPGAAASAADGNDRQPSPEIVDALTRLSPRQRAVIHLAYWEDLTPADIADRIGISEGSVRRHLARARQNLRSSLQAVSAETDGDRRSLLGGAP